MILVTGAVGYIGRHLVSYLREQGHTVVGISRQDADLVNPNHVAALQWRLAEVPETVIHLAGKVDIALEPNPIDPTLPPIPGKQDIVGLYRDNVVATVNVLEYCLKVSVKHLIFASTQAVYGALEYDSNYDIIPNPLEHYAASKLAAERLLEVGRRQGLRINILRLPGIFGGDRKQGAVYSMCKSAIKERVIRLEMSIPLPFNAMHIEDVMAAIAATVAWRPINERQRMGATTDIAIPGHCSLGVLADEIAYLVPGCTIRRAAPSQPDFWTPCDFEPFDGALDWHPKSRKERLRQMLEEARLEETTSRS